MVRLAIRSVLQRPVRSLDMTRRPDSPPDECSFLQERNYLKGLTTLVSAILGILAIATLAPGIVTHLIAPPSNLFDLILSPQGKYYVLLAVPVFLVNLEIHEQSHRLAAIGLDLQPTYRRWRPFDGGGYILVQETWISRRESNLMTVAPIFTIQLPALLIALVAPGTLGTIAEITFVVNASMLAKDVADIGFNFRLPKEAQFWVSDLGEEPVEYYAVPS